jgi:hypothetical protein
MMVMLLRWCESGPNPPDFSFPGTTMRLDIGRIRPRSRTLLATNTII